MMQWSTFSSLFNGERTVVLIFISRVLFSLSPSLLLEGLSLFLLTLSSLLIEISLDDFKYSTPFKARPGASSGILLGAVTLPAVFITRLIQLLRTSPFNEGIPDGFEHLKVQYWATASCCFTVLLFFCIIWHSSNEFDSNCLHSDLDTKLVLGCFVLYASLCCLSFSTASGYSILTMLKLLWILIHGLVAVKLIQHVLRIFPSCASIGEALLVTGGLVLYFSDMLAFTFSKVHKCMLPSLQVHIIYEIKRSEITTITQGLLLGLLLFPMVFKCMLQIRERFVGENYSERSNELEKSFIFYSSLAIISIVIIPSWMQFVQEFHVHPFLWVFMFVISEPLKRLSLCLYWLTVIYASIGRFYYISKNSKMERILLRKYYHLMAVSMFLPALIFQPMFLDLAFGVALAVFLTLEIIRVWRIWPLGHLIHQFMNAFTDHRDSDVLIVSHFSLLLGCALPMWMCCEYNDRPLAPFAGILSLGIGDTMASVVGHKYGVLRWSKSGKKTMEGTAAGITSVLAACFVILPLLASSTGYIAAREQNWTTLVWAVVVSGLLEAYTTQLDNAFIPLVFYTLISL